MKFVLASLALPGTAFVCLYGTALADDDNKNRKSKCAVFRETKLGRYQPHRAYAENPSGTICGISYRYLYLTDAEHRAKKECEEISKEDCHIVFSK